MTTKRDERSEKARRALLDGCIARYHDWRLNPQIASDADLPIVEDIILSWDVVEKIKRLKEPLFPQRLGGAHSSVWYEQTLLGKKFLLLGKIDFLAIQSAFPHHQLHPYVGLAEKYSAHVENLQSPQSRQDFDELNLCAKRLKSESLSSVTQKQCETFLKRTRENSRSLSNYVGKLWQKYEHLLVVHLDVGYNRFWLAQSNGAINVTFEEAQIHREALFLHLKRKFPYKLRGFVWRLEHSESRSFHFQLLLFFETSEIYRSIDIAWRVGELWRNQITCGKGMYFNRNVSEFLHPGIGLISSTSKENVAALKKEVIPRLMEPGKLIRLAIPGARTFDKGNMPKPDKRKRGRPATKSQYGQ